MQPYTRLFIATVTLLAATAFGTSVAAQETPLDFDRPLEAIELPAYALQLERGETASFETVGVARITIGETAILSKKFEEERDRFIVTAERAGTTVLRAYRSDGSEVTVQVTVVGGTSAK